MKSFFNFYQIFMKCFNVQGMFFSQDKLLSIKIFTNKNKIIIFI